MIKFDPIYSNLIQFYQVCAKLIQSNPIWSNLNQFVQVWSNLNQFDQVWSNLFQFDQVWSIWSSLIQFILLYSNLIKFDQVWSNLIQFEPILSCFNQIINLMQFEAILSDMNFQKWETKQTWQMPRSLSSKLCLSLKMLCCTNKRKVVFKKYRWNHQWKLYTYKVDSRHKKSVLFSSYYLFNLLMEQYEPLIFLTSKHDFV